MADTSNKPSFDSGLILPIIFGVFSIFGLCLVLLVARLGSFRAVTPIEETSTPFQFILLGTEPGFTTLTPEDEPTVEEETNDRGTPTPRASAPATRRVTSTSTKDDIILLASPTRTRTPPSLSTPTPTSASPAPFNPGTYDDSDSRIFYSSGWTSQNGVNGVFKNTLHVSNTLNSTMTIRFIGEQIRIFYQSGSSLGTIRINLDGLEFDLDESANIVAQSEWVSPMLINGTHTVTITHLSGGAVNFDGIVIPEPIKTPTPTP